MIKYSILKSISSDILSDLICQAETFQRWRSSFQEINKDCSKFVHMFGSLWTELLDYGFMNINTVVASRFQRDLGLVVKINNIVIISLVSGRISVIWSFFFSVPSL